MLNGKTLMLLLGGVILSGCGPEPSDPQGNNPAELKQKRTIQKENSAQAGDDHCPEKTSRGRPTGCEKKQPEYAEAKALADAKAASLATAEAPQYVMQTRAAAPKAFAAQGGNVMGTARYEPLR
ncbi:hypothetical protein [Salmonella enterica]|uniref:hypothetical protein n=1 Tax=Salmonella enterica TaxID=28901 RepID=UPI001E4C834A|nr:hypothetical protein [Salmonella enterica]